MAHKLCMLDKQGYTRLYSPMRPGTHPPTHIQTRTHARAPTHTHRKICNTYCFFTLQQWFRVTFDVYCLSYYNKQLILILLKVLARTAQ